MSQKQCTLPHPTDVTAIILNAGRRLLPDIWDGTPIRQVSLGVSHFVRDRSEQLVLFEDSRLEYYRQWDRDYDAAHARPAGDDAAE